MIVERTPAIVYLELPDPPADGTSAIVYVSPQIERILGVPPEAWLGDGSWIDQLHPDDRDRAVAGAEGADGAEFYSDEYRMVAADGSVIWFHDESVLIRDENGAPAMWQGVMVDVTEQKDAEHLLRAAQERYRALVEHIPAVVYAEAIVANAEDFYVSPQVEQVFGYTPEEWQWTPSFWMDRIHPDDKTRHARGER